MNAVVAKQPVPLEALRRCSLFVGLDDAECRQIAGILREFQAEPGELILRQGETEQELWLLTSGACDVIRQADARRPDDEPVVLATLEPGETLGEMSFFQPAPHSASVRAKTAVTLLRISRRDFDDRVNHGCRASYKLAVNMVGTLAQRLRQMDQWVGELLQEEDAPPKQAEWSGFRDKLFKEWNL